MQTNKVLESYSINNQQLFYRLKLTKRNIFKEACFKLFFNYILSIVSLICMIVFTTIAYVRVPITTYLKPEQVLDANLRVISLASIILYVFSAYFHMKNMIIWAKIVGYKEFGWQWAFIATLGLINIFNPFFVWSVYKTYRHLFRNSIQKYEFVFFKYYLARYTNNNWCWITYLFVVLMMVTSFVILIVAPIINVDHNKLVVEDSFVLNALSYFTQITNITCFIFVIFLKEKLIKYKKYLINITAYMIIVGLVFWLGMTPNFIKNGFFEWDTSAHILKSINSIWLHFINQTLIVIIFVIFSRIGYRKNYFKHNWKKASNQYLGFLTYLLLYGCYMYTLPFLVPYSVYGFASNANPNLVFHGIQGSYFILFGTLLILLISAIIFYSTYFLHAKIAKDIIKT